MTKDNPDQFQATISTTSTGVGFVAPPAKEAEMDADDLDDYVIPEDHINGAFDGDVVLVRPRPELENDHGDLTIAEVVSVVRRAKTTFVGTVQKNGDTYFLLPDKKDMYEDIFIHTDKDLPDGHKAVVEITDWGRPEAGENPSGTVSEVLGPKGDHEVEMQSIIKAKDIEVDFPQPVMDEAAKLEDWSIDQVDVSDRRDFREVTTMTIDPETAKDFDDGLSFRELDNDNYEVGIHIADVSHFVKPDTAIDQEARKRAFSVYLVDRTIPMLPPILSNDLCSLKPDVDRLAFSAVFEITPDAEIVDQWFGKSVIHSDKRFNYHEAQDQIDSGTDNFSKQLQVLNRIAQTLRDRRFDNGSIDFHGEEVEFDLADDGTPKAITKKDRVDTHKMIEEYMLLANREIAREIKRMTEDEDEKHFFMYRVHGLPDRDRLGELGVFLRALGYDFELEE
ncbi:MAG: ribonuclease R, partial [Parcubacteria group bacterium SW_6_46_9]